MLEIGTGSGYQAAILSRLAREVVSIERYRTLADAARERIRTLGYTNVTIRAGDGMAGAPDLAPFDRIMVTAAAEEVPEALVAQLAEGGKMMLPVGPRNDAQHIVKLTKAAGRRINPRKSHRRAFCAAFAGSSARTVTAKTLNKPKIKTRPTLKRLFTPALFSRSLVLLLRASE